MSMFNLAWTPTATGFTYAARVLLASVTVFKVAIFHTAALTVAPPGLFQAHAHVGPTERKL